MQRTISVTSIIAIVLWGWTAVVPAIRAQGVGQPDMGVTEDGLRQMLENMGYSPKKLSNGYLIEIKQESWTYYVQLVLSKDKSKLGFNSNLGVVEKPEEIAANKWMDLLISNGNIDPSFFFLDKESKKLYLHRSLDNRAITPAFLRAQIENFRANIKETGELWKFTK